MSVAIEEKQLVVKRARAIAAMGLVGRDENGFQVTTPGVRKETFSVWRDEEGRVHCSCPQFEDYAREGIRFRCEHILAVKFHLEPPDEADGAEPTEPEEELQEAEAPEAATEGNVLPFAEVLKALSQSVSPDMVKSRVGWRDRNGREHEVDYVEWHTVADLLDRICPDWSHTVNQITQIGDIVAVTASITIRGVTRQGIGTGSAYEEIGIKKAEHDALKRAAVKFGIARELYRREEEITPPRQGDDTPAARYNFPRDPVAKTMADLVTPKQLVAIRAIANAQRLDAEAECMEVLKCKPEELTRRAASAFIDYLKQKNAEGQEVRQLA